MSDPHESNRRADSHGLSRRTFAGGAAAATGAALIGLTPGSARAASGSPPRATIGTVADAPNLPPGFRDTFKSRFVRANGITQHVVIGGGGPPLVLIHGWPETWYAWRFLMPRLAQRFTVIAPDQRGIGRSTAATDGYDAANLANDVVALVDALGYGRFAAVGHDTGYIIGYALAADHPDRVARIALAEIPGPPGVGHDPSLFLPDPVNDRVWHLTFNRVADELIIDMVHGFADGFFGYEYAIQSGGATLTAATQAYYVELYNRDRDRLRATFGLYRALFTTYLQNQERAKTSLTLPILGIGGEKSYGPASGDALRPVATNVQTAVIPGVGHWVAETAPAAMLQLLDEFLTPYAVSGARRRAGSRG